MIPLLILGLLKQKPGSHGYELLSLIEEKQYIKKVNPSESTRETNNYIITGAGNREFEKLMFKYGSKTDYVNLSFYTAMLFGDEYNDNELKKLIEICWKIHVLITW